MPNRSLLRHFARGLARRTHSNGLSPILYHSNTVHRVVSVLTHHHGGGPVIINRTNINGATVIRNLTSHVTTNRIPRILGNIRLLSLSVNLLRTNTDIGNRFRHHLGNIVSRIGTSPGPVVVFVSRTRALVNTNNGTNNSSTTGLLGPTLTHNRLHAVTTAA